MKQITILNLLHWVLFMIGAGMIAGPLFLELLYDIPIRGSILIIGMFPIFVSGYVKRMAVEEREKQK